MRKLIFIAIGFLLNLTGFAQQVYMFSNYTNNQYVLNPAASGMYDYVQWNTSYRKQWSGIDGAPTSMYTSFNMAINKQKNRHFRSKDARHFYYKHNKHKLHHGIGALVSQDEFGAFQKTRIQASYGVHIPLFGPYRISFATRIGMGNTALDPGKVTLKDASDPTYTFYLADNNKKVSFDADFGLWFYSDKWYAGYSALQVVPNGYTPADVSKDGMQLSHHHVTGGYHIVVMRDRDYDDLESRNIVVTPSAMFRYRPGTPINVDVSAQVHFEQRGRLGFSWRMDNAMAIWAGVDLGHKMAIMYAYDIPTNTLSTIQTGSHEFSITINLFNGKMGSGRTRF
jgi:type IX secretion system PorP/SprF family membrane protein